MGIIIQGTSEFGGFRLRIRVEYSSNVCCSVLRILSLGRNFYFHSYVRGARPRPEGLQVKFITDPLSNSEDIPTCDRAVAPPGAQVDWPADVTLC